MPSDEAAKHQEQKYYERLDISVLSIAKIKDLIKSDIKETINAWEKGRDVQKQCWHVVGPAGVGKTEICYQIAEEHTNELEKLFEIIMVKAPVLSRDDFIIPREARDADPLTCEGEEFTVGGNLENWVVLN